MALIAGSQIGVLGHVDSGKTSLVRSLSTTVSTAGLDKHKQSQERGITLDLGFSSFVLPTPPQLQEAEPDCEAVTVYPGLGLGCLPDKPRKWAL